MDHRGRGRGTFLRGRARFIIRRDTVAHTSPKWTHDKFQVNGEQRDTQERDTQQDHKEGEKDGDNENT